MKVVHHSWEKEKAKKMEKRKSEERQMGKKQSRALFFFALSFSHFPFKALLCFFPFSFQDF
jgi:hypothetical protein